MAVKSSMSKFIVLVVLALVTAVSSQSYPHFELRGRVLVNNSFVYRMEISVKVTVTHYIV